MTVRADAAYAAGMLSRAMSKPTPSLLAAAKRVMQYLYATRELGIRYTRGADYTPAGMSDSDWQVRCSTSGYVFLMACAVVSFLSKKQPSIAMASAQAEVYAASLAGLEASFLVNFIEVVTKSDVSPVSIGVDSSAAVSLANDFVSNSRVRHYERRHLKVRELVERGIVAVSSISTDDNIADIFTKPLGARKFAKFRKQLLNM